MSSNDIDIRKRCKGICSDNFLLRVENGDVKEAQSYGYCTHKRFIGSWIGKVNYGKKPLLIGNERSDKKPFSEIHTRIEEVTTYYHQEYDRDTKIIKAPLLIAIREYSRAGYKWYKNTGNNRIWKEIPETENIYPNNNTDSADSGFKKQLDRLACSLHYLHRVNIRNGTNEPNYCCPVCSQYGVDVTKQKGIQEIYTRIDHSPQESAPYHVTYQDALIKYQGPGTKPNLISVKKGDYDKISVYYWEGDSDRNNPLLIEVTQASTKKSTWYENIGESGGKHDKWIKLEQEDANLSSGNLKTKLDYLSCAFNNAVRINLGRDSGCHDSGNGNHKSRIKTRHNGTVDKALLLSAYEYTPSKESGGKSFSVAELFIGSQRQKNESGNIFFKDVTKLSSYASFCDTTNPFLICVEYTGRNEWYQRNTNDKNTWEKKDGELFGQIGNIFNSVHQTLSINKCSHYRPPQTGVQINITEQPKDGTLDGTYVSSGSGTLSILMTKDYISPQKDFFKISHRPATDNETFVVSRDLQSGGKIGMGSGKKWNIIEGVQNVDAYFWIGMPKEPILVGVKQNTGTTLHGMGQHGTRWMLDQVKGLSEQQALEHQNCQLNGAIPFDIQNPTKDHSGGKSDCLKSRKIEESAVSPKHPPGGEYTTKEYTINKGGAKISRVIFDGIYTNICATKDTVTKVRICYWKNDPNISSRAIPLLVGFVKSGVIDWYENNGTGSRNLYWTHIKESKDYYDQNGIGQNPRQSLTDKLDEVNCRIHHAVKINISRKNDLYCHERCRPERIKVKKSATSLLDGYIGYDHISNIYRETFTVTAIINDATNSTRMNTVLRDVKRVTVYFQSCDKDIPVTIRIEDSRGTEKWLNRTVEGNGWELSNQNDLPRCQTTSGPSSTKNLSVSSGDSSSESEDSDTGGKITDINQEESYSKMLTNLAKFGVSMSTAAEELGTNAIKGIIDKTLSPTIQLVENVLEDVLTPVVTPQQLDSSPPATTSSATGDYDPASSGDAQQDSATSTPVTPTPTEAKAAAVTGIGEGLATGLGSWAIFGGSTSGTLAGAGGLTGFGLWKLYNRYKGDPWVRHGYPMKCLKHVPY
ncbi:hypothetical protein BEWA_015890 [Theileria equi strain WA]|uniref:Uncharacterized protein n=1 Tax=Theileria equi strain WA TaxID=1537102 RepID=L1LCX6_THEEQ|nr:hypothetical protein BEWA_015890 [Theileria equi strain WA]EKX73028.1 hypothetical protein BEWA_015890 [Theileria equi strain WA]|eukprot:XP_004832480.1 hypothetical protein BEWA_015890 [Theileria equi strain WA]